MTDRSPLPAPSLFGLATRARRFVTRFAPALMIALAGDALDAASASAYCRTTTVPPGAGYDPSTTGQCWTQGRTIAWPSGQRIGYEIDQSASVQVDLGDVTTAASEAFAAWNKASCAFGDGGNPNIEGYEIGTVDAALVAVDCGLVQCGPTVHDTNHVITFRDSSWTSDDPANTLALTIVTYGVTSGTIFDADIEINTAQNTISAANPPPPNAYDLRSILTHEAGHFFGLAHSQETSAVMYAYYHPDSIVLTADDVDGICAIYGPSTGGSSGGGCALTSSPTSSNLLATGAAVLALGAVFVRRRRR